MVWNDVPNQRVSSEGRPLASDRLICPDQFVMRVA